MGDTSAFGIRKCYDTGIWDSHELNPAVVRGYCKTRFCSSRFAGGVPPFFAVWGGQTERETPLCNLKLHAARFGVCIGLAALVGVLPDVDGKSLFLVGVVGADMD